ncbi:MAG: sucrose-6-phosphate hydrolase [Phycisphaerales bacterium]
MGKPYKKDLDLLPKTYSWALNVDVSGLSEAISSCCSSPLIVVGSGGAFSAADFIVNLHQRYSGKLAKSVTPYEMKELIGQIEGASIIILSAGGNNKDILGLCKLLGTNEPKRVIIICGRRSSPLSRIAKRFSFMSCFEYELPSIKDGFLATNSLLAFSILSYRSYTSVFTKLHKLPNTFGQFMHPDISKTAFLKNVEKETKHLWEKNAFTVLYGPVSRSGAIDLESKFTEAALGNVQLADYRNFAHGRHHWFAKRGDNTGIITFISKDDLTIAEKTLSLLPVKIPIFKIYIPYDQSIAGIYSLVMAIIITYFAGRIRGIDPGQPGVPAFGRAIYHLNGFANTNHNKLQCSYKKNVLVRKTGMSLVKLVEDQSFDFWRKLYTSFVNEISTIEFDGLVLDYDGTLCQKRFDGWPEELSTYINKLLENRIPIGVATGRGNSIRKDLVKYIPKKYWRMVIVGYLNGSDIATLNDANHPIQGDTNSNLKSLAHLLQSNASIYRLFETIKEYPNQLTIRLKNQYYTDYCWQNINELVFASFSDSLKVVRSSHSIDILSKDVSKYKVIDVLKRNSKSKTPKILCIGDKGSWPGNDFSLLSEPLSLSVDESSSNCHSCWNIAPPGKRGIQATMYYLKALQIIKKTCKFKFVMDQ